jgi:hypothetical protein
VSQLLILQPGADQITIVFYVFKHVLEGREPPRYLPVTAQHSPAFGQQLPEPGGHVVRAARTSAREAPDWNSLTRLVSSSPAMATSRTAVVASCPAGARPAAPSPGLRAKGSGGVSWMARRTGGRLLPGQQAIDLGNMRRQRQVQGPASVRPAQQMRELAGGLLGDRSG